MAKSKGTSWFMRLAFLGLVGLACWHFWPHETKKVADKAQRAAAAAYEQAKK